ncbi:HAD family hydrolase [Leptospira wolffii]|uniref:HAD-IA family hydrolase n=1 Tax=Leptospira wolffii TaxID=409998 RepID=UPI0010830E9A|nr:HAD-IA family hydrolase [Leptospira wolffii]TGK62420.1 HAD family hydrolase [Leptospira wolffii]TGK70640.1 HAD family hydrolase [Leptospira wolffii]TGK74196.1 HAD family hydrolase [Leptospira wolffii]TGL32229.1 HAD family hydrolase [Leptospira wolffii]
MSSKERYIYLDVGDTLLTMKRPAGEVYFEVLKEFGLGGEKFPPGFMERAFRKAYAHMTRVPLPEHRDKFHAHVDGSEGWWRDLLGFFLKEIGSDLEPNPIFQSIFRKFDEPSVWEVDPGFLELLDFAKKNDFGLGIISNWDHRLKQLLSSVGVLHHFDPVLVSAEFGYEKPSPLIFEAAEKLSGLSADKLVYCGDKVELDIIPTRARGWTAFHKHPDGDIRDLSELVSRLHF